MCCIIHKTVFAADAAIIVFVVGLGLKHVSPREGLMLLLFVFVVVDGRRVGGVCICVFVCMRECWLCVWGITVHND